MDLSDYYVVTLEFLDTLGRKQTYTSVGYAVESDAVDHLETIGEILQLAGIAVTLPLIVGPYPADGIPS